MRNFKCLLSLDDITYYLCRNIRIERSQGLRRGERNKKIFSNHDIGCPKTVLQMVTIERIYF